MIPNRQSRDWQTHPVNPVLVVMIWTWNSYWTLIVNRPQRGHVEPEPSSEDTSEDGSDYGLISVPDSVKPCYRVRATGEAQNASPTLPALIDLSNVDIAPVQEQDPSLLVVMDMLCASPE